MLLCRFAENLHCKSDVFVNGLVLEKSEVLKHESHFASEIRNFSVRELMQTVLIKIYSALGELFFSEKQFCKRCFSCAGRSILNTNSPSSIVLSSH